MAKLTAPQQMDAEHIREMEGKRRETLERFVQLDKQGRIINVNWKAIVDFKRECNWYKHRVFEALYDDLIEYLHAKEFLKYECERGCVSITGHMGVSGGPRHTSTSYHGFSRREDAEAYMATFYKHHSFEVFIKPARETQ